MRPKLLLLELKADRKRKKLKRVESTRTFNVGRKSLSSSTKQ